MLHSAEHHFYHALILAAAEPSDTSRSRGPGGMGQIRKIAGRMRRWADRCPHNFAHKERLVAAELRRLEGDLAGAASAYDEAARAAARYGYLQVEAMARHREAGLHRLHGRPAASARSLGLARDLYARWGATALAEALGELPGQGWQSAGGPDTPGTASV